MATDWEVLAQLYMNHYIAACAQGRTLAIRYWALKLDWLDRKLNQIEG